MRSFFKKVKFVFEMIGFDIGKQRHDPKAVFADATWT
jgi:hypothetical protein